MTIKTTVQEHRVLARVDSDSEGINSSLFSRSSKLSNSCFEIKSIPVAEYQRRPIVNHTALKNRQPCGALIISRESIDASLVSEVIRVISCWCEEKNEWDNWARWIYGSVIGRRDYAV